MLPKPTEMRGRRGNARKAAPGGDTSPAGILVKLPYRPPLAWTAMLDFLAHRAIPGVESVDNGCYRRTIEVDGAGGVLEVAAPAMPAPQEAPTKSAREKARRAAAPHHSAHLLMRVELPHCHNLIGVVERARRIFDLGADPVPIAAHLQRDPRLASLIVSTPGLRVPGAWDPFELSVRAVLGQQVTVQGATTLAGRLVREFGKPLDAPSGCLTHLFPTAQVVAEADLSRVGVTKARAAALGNLAGAVASGRLRFDAALGLDDAVARLCEIPGLGPWTAHYIAMRALAEPDAFPETDLGLRRALGSAEELASVADVREAAEAWRPWRSYAAIYLWSGLGAVPAIDTLPASSATASSATASSATASSATVKSATVKSSTVKSATAKSPSAKPPAAPPRRISSVKRAQGTPAPAPAQPLSLEKAS